MAFVDAQTGRTFYPPLSVHAGDRLVPAMFGTGPVFDFRLESRLFTMQACPERELHAPCYAYYFLLEAGRWRLLLRQPLGSEP